MQRSEPGICILKECDRKEFQTLLVILIVVQWSRINEERNAVTLYYGHLHIRPDKKKVSKLSERQLVAVIRNWQSKSGKKNSRSLFLRDHLTKFQSNRLQNVANNKSRESLQRSVTEALVWIYPKKSPVFESETRDLDPVRPKTSKLASMKCGSDTLYLHKNWRFMELTMWNA